MTCPNNYWKDPSYRKQSWIASQRHEHGCRFLYIIGNKDMGMIIVTFQTWLTVLFLVWSHHQERMNMGVLHFPAENMGLGRSRSSGSSEQQPCGPRIVCLFEEPEGQTGEAAVVFSFRMTSQLACTGSRCGAAAGQHLGRASGNPLHI